MPRTGAPIPSFGKDGVVDLKLENDQEIDLVTGDIGLHAAPVIAEGRRSSSAPRTREGSRAATARRTRRATCAASTCAPASGSGSSTPFRSPASSATTRGRTTREAYTGNTGVWAQMSVDEELGHRLPASRDADRRLLRRASARRQPVRREPRRASICKTGKRKWHYQFIHHGIWDWDLPCAPILADMTSTAACGKVVAQPTKQGWLFVFDRVTGEPVWPIEERPVEQSDVPGEKYAADAAVRHQAARRSSARA